MSDRDSLQGRWTVWLKPDGEESFDAHESAEPMPVVPCDAAAIERVAAELARQRGWTWADAGDGVRTALTVVAAKALRAAGKTP